MTLTVRPCFRVGPFALGLILAGVQVTLVGGSQTFSTQECAHSVTDDVWHYVMTFASVSGTR